MSKASLSRFSSALLAVAACALLTLPALADSQARIVRLSDVQGSVQIDKNTGLGFENAFLNLPITQGTQLKTLKNGRAEVEFEDGSTLRLTPDTTVEFSTLSLSDAGKHISEINLVEGMAYVNWLGKSGDEFTLNFSREKIALDHAAHFRVDASTEAANLAVFKGDIEVDGPDGKLIVAKNKTASFDAADDDKSTLANNITEAPLDSWDKESIAYHDQYAKNNSSPYGYGAADLGYYGSYTNVPGYGTMWQPYFTGVGWVPLHGWRVVLVSRLRLHVCFGLSLGMDAVPVWKLDVYPGIRLDVAAGRMGQLAGRAALLRFAYSAFPPPGRANWNCAHGRSGEGRTWFHSVLATAGRECGLCRLGDSPRFARKSQASEQSGREKRICGSAAGSAVRRDFRPRLGLQRNAQHSVEFISIHGACLKFRRTHRRWWRSASLRRAFPQLQ